MKDFINNRSGTSYGYFEILDAIKADLIEPTESGLDSLFQPSDRRRFWLRHDIDNHIHLAWAMAEAERDRGIKSAYFFLHTAPYFRNGVFINIANDFIKAGHTIGLHNNAVAIAYRGGDISLADSILQRDLDYIRKAGPVFITASHGDIWNRHNNIMNYEMFTECRRSGSFPHHSLSHYGLKYEAYFTPRDFYLSDSGGVWSSIRDINIQGQQEDFKGIPKGESPFTIINSFNQSISGIMQVLIHPEWWEPKT